MDMWILIKVLRQHNAEMIAFSSNDSETVGYWHNRKVIWDHTSQYKQKLKQNGSSC